MNLFEIVRLLAYINMTVSGAYIAVVVRRAYFTRTYPFTGSLGVICGVLSFYGLVIVLVLLGGNGIFEFPFSREILTLPVIVLSGTMMYVAFLVRDRVKTLKDRSKRE